MLTNTGHDIPTGRDERNRFRISDLIQINEGYNCNDRSNDNHFQTFMLYCDSDLREMYPVSLSYLDQAKKPLPLRCRHSKLK